MITVAYNSVDVLAGLCASVELVAPGAEIIVVDNGSDDGTVELARAQRNVRLVEAHTNIGFGRGCNAGAGAASGQWLIFANPDVRVTGLTLPRLANGERFGVGAGRVADGVGPYASGIRAERTLPEDWYHGVLARFLPRRVNMVLPTRRRPAGWAYGALMVVRADEFAALGGFDDRFFLYQEDRDLGARYRQRGMPIRDVRLLTARHLKGQSVGGASDLHAEAWAFVSWIEYLCIWRGADDALRVAYNAVRVLRLISTTCARAIVGSRARAKAAYAQELLTRILTFDTYLPIGATSCYPAARNLLVGIRNGLATH